VRLEHTHDQHNVSQKGAPIRGFGRRYIHYLEDILPLFEFFRFFENVLSFSMYYNRADVINGTEEGLHIDKSKFPRTKYELLKKIFRNVFLVKMAPISLNLNEMSVLWSSEFLKKRLSKPEVIRIIALLTSK